MLRQIEQLEVELRCLAGREVDQIVVSNGDQAIAEDGEIAERLRGRIGETGEQVDGGAVVGHVVFDNMRAGIVAVDHDHVVLRGVDRIGELSNPDILCLAIRDLEFRPASTATDPLPGLIAATST